MASHFRTAALHSPVRAAVRTTERKRRRRPHLLLLLCLLLTGIALLHAIAISHPTGTPTTWNTCENLIRNIDYTKHVPPLRKTQEMSAIQFVDELVGGEPAALVQVEESQEPRTLDVYVFGCTVRKHVPTLKRLFQQRGLRQGSATITRAHTLSIGELDLHLDRDAYATLQPFQQNIFREYRWIEGTFRQVSFPGLYPVLSRSEAEALQDEADKRQSLPWTDPLTTARQLAQDIFHWPSNETLATLTDIDDATAHIQLLQQNTHINVNVTLMRLLRSEQETKAGLWFVTDAHTEGMSDKEVQVSAEKPSSVTLRGSIQAEQEKREFQVQFFDHTLSLITKKDEPTITRQTDGSYSITFPARRVQSSQPGLLMIESIPSESTGNSGGLRLVGLLLNVDEG